MSGPLHGASMYKRGCRCDKCRIANTAYEKKRREERRQQKLQAVKRRQADGDATGEAGRHAMRRGLHTCDAMTEIACAPAPTAARPDPSARTLQNAGPLAGTEQGAALLPLR